MLAKTFEEAAVAVDDMFNAALQNAGCEFGSVFFSLDTSYLAFSTLRR